MSEGGLLEEEESGMPLRNTGSGERPNEGSERCTTSFGLNYCQTPLAPHIPAKVDTHNVTHTESVVMT